MRQEVIVPEVAENVEEGRIISVLVREGEPVAVDQPLVELETDKAVVSIPSPGEGKVSRIRVKEGDTVHVGDPLLDLEDGTSGRPGPVEPETHIEEEKTPPATAGTTPEAAPPPAAEATPGAQAPPEPEATRAAAPSEEAPAPAPEERPEASPAGPDPEATPERPPLSGPASPSVRRLARELGADLHEVQGSGREGRISEEDVKRHVRAQQGGRRAPERVSGRAPPARKPLPDLSRWGPVHREKLNRVREVTAETMARAWATIPQVTHRERADVTDLEAFRRRWNEGRKGVTKLTSTVVLVKAVAAALRAFPRFNAVYDEETRELVVRDYVHVAVAVDTPHGLLVPVIRDVDRKGLVALAEELDDLARRTRDRRMDPAELEGGGFTVSNLGGIGGTDFSPIVYPPQVAILGVSRAAMEPRWDGTVFVPRLALPLALTYDHRVIDGAEAARFLRWLVEALEEPLRLAL